MKKYMTLAVVAMMMAAAGCQKMNDIQTENQDFKIEFTVADKPSFGTDTKAVKTSWAVGDQIAIALKPSSEANVLYLSPSIAVRSSVAVLLEYTAGGWTATGNITPEAGTNGTFYAIHHRGDVNFNFTSTGGTNPENSYELAGYQGGELMSFTGSYNVASNGNLILESIVMALDTRLMQVSTAEILEGNENTDNDEFAAVLCTADGGDTIELPEKTVKMSIYKNWTAGDTPETMSSWVALSQGSVSVDFSESKLFVYSSDDQYKTGAVPVLNYYDDFDCDYAFCFAYTGGKSLELISKYTFYIERTPEAGAGYTISYDELYLTVAKSDNRTLGMRKAIKLSDQGWTAVMD